MKFVLCIAHPTIQHLPCYWVENTSLGLKVKCRVSVSTSQNCKEALLSCIGSAKTICIWYLQPYGVVVSMLDFHRSDGVRIPAMGVKFQNVYDYTIVRHPWQVSENHMPRAHPNHVREIGEPVPDDTQD